MSVDQSNEAVENMGPQMSGVVEVLNRDGSGFSQIRGTDGKIYRFHFGTCVDKQDIFYELKEGTRVTFNEFTGEGFKKTTSQNTILGQLYQIAQEHDLGLAAVNVALDASERTDILVPEVKSATTQALESVENMGNCIHTGMVIITDRQNGKGEIYTNDGKRYEFHFSDCKGGIDTFNRLENNTNISFKGRAKPTANNGIISYACDIEEYIPGEIIKVPSLDNESIILKPEIKKEIPQTL